MLNNLALFHVCVWWGWKIVEEQYAIMQLQKILQPAFAIALCKLHRGNFCDSRAQPPSDWRQPYLLFVCILGMIGDALGKNGNWKFPQGRHKNSWTLLSVNNQHNPPDHIMNKDEEMQKKAKMPTNPKMQKNAKKMPQKSKKCKKSNKKYLMLTKPKMQKNASPPAVHHHIRCITTLGASSPSVHHLLRCITTYSASPPSVHHHIQCITTSIIWS